MDHPEIEKILAEKVHCGRRLYLIKWSHAKSSENTWEYEDYLQCEYGFIEIDILVKKYSTTQKKKKYSIKSEHIMKDDMIKNEEELSLNSKLMVSPIIPKPQKKRASKSIKVVKSTTPSSYKKKQTTAPDDILREIEQGPLKKEERISSDQRNKSDTPTVDSSNVESDGNTFSFWRNITENPSIQPNDDIEESKNQNFEDIELKDIQPKPDEIITSYDERTEPMNISPRTISDDILPKIDNSRELMNKSSNPSSEDVVKEEIPSNNVVGVLEDVRIPDNESIEPMNISQKPTDNDIPQESEVTEENRIKSKKNRVETKNVKKKKNSKPKSLVQGFFATVASVFLQQTESSSPEGSGSETEEEMMKERNYLLNTIKELDEPIINDSLCVICNTLCDNQCFGCSMKYHENCFPINPIEVNGLKKWICTLCISQNFYCKKCEKESSYQLNHCKYCFNTFDEACFHSPGKCIDCFNNRQNDIITIISSSGSQNSLSKRIFKIKIQNEKRKIVKGDWLLKYYNEEFRCYLGISEDCINIEEFLNYQYPQLILWENSIQDKYLVKWRGKDFINSSWVKSNVLPPKLIEEYTLSKSIEENKEEASSFLQNLDISKGYFLITSQLTTLKTYSKLIVDYLLTTDTSKLPILIVTSEESILKWEANFGIYLPHKRIIKLTNDNTSSSILIQTLFKLNSHNTQVKDISAKNTLSKFDVVFCTNTQLQKWKSKLLDFINWKLLILDCTVDISIIQSTHSYFNDFKIKPQVIVFALFHHLNLLMDDSNYLLLSSLMNLNTSSPRMSEIFSRIIFTGFKEKSSKRGVFLVRCPLFTDQTSRYVHALIHVHSNTLQRTFQRFNGVKELELIQDITNLPKIDYENQIEISGKLLCLSYLVKSLSKSKSAIILRRNQSSTLIKYILHSINVPFYSIMENSDINRIDTPIEIGTVLIICEDLLLTATTAIFEVNNLIFFDTLVNSNRFQEIVRIYTTSVYQLFTTNTIEEIVLQTLDDDIILVEHVNNTTNFLEYNTTQIAKQIDEISCIAELYNTVQDETLLECAFVKKYVPRIQSSIVEQWENVIKNPIINNVQQAEKFCEILFNPINMDIICYKYPPVDVETSVHDNRQPSVSCAISDFL